MSESTLINSNFVRTLDAVDPAAVERLARVQQLAEAGAAKDLAGIELDGILNPSALEERAVTVFRRQPRLIAWIEWFRNALVLLPITVTWLGLARATQAYNLLLANHREFIDQPFLLLWQRGFEQLVPGYPAWMTFSTLALADFGILIAVVLLTLLVHGYRDIAQDNAERAAAALRLEAEDQLWRLANYQGALRWETSQSHALATIDKSLASFLDVAQKIQAQLDAERQRVIKLAEASDKDRAEMKTAVQSLQAATTQLAGASNDAKAGQSTLKEAIDGLAQNVKKVREAETALAQGFSTVATHSSMLLEGVAVSSNSLQQGIKALTSVDTERATEASTMLGAAKRLDEVAGVLAQALGGFKNSHLALRDAAEQIKADSQFVRDEWSTSWSAAQKHFVDQLNKLQGDLQTAAQGIGHASESESKIMAALRDSADSVARLVGAQERVESRARELSQKQNASIEQLDNVVNGIGHLLERLDNVSAGLDEGARSLADEHREMRAALTEMVREWRGMVATAPAGQRAEPARLSRVLPWVAVLLCVAANVTLFLVMR